jgi:hypothetical protein
LIPRLKVPAAFVLMAVFGLGLALFYARYIPLVPSFQAVFAPVLAIIALVAFLDPRTGTFLFIVLFPLVNNLPYFYKLYEPLPHAPTALVLFLFYFFGWTGSRLVRSKPIRLGSPVLKPLGLFSALVVVSGLITFWRYADFAPFLSGRIYELVTNAHGVTAGGAIMSVVFNGLNYISGFAFLAALNNTLGSEEDLKPLALCALIGASIAVPFAYFQYLGHLSFGNNPSSLFLNLTNATFKDAMSFGAYLAMAIPFFLGIVFSWKGVSRVWSALLIAPAVGALFLTGSKSGLLSLPAALAVFAALNIGSARRLLKPGTFSIRRLHWSSRVVAGLVAALVLAAVIFHRPLVRELGGSRTLARLPDIFSKDVTEGAVAARSKVLWKLALPMIRDYPLSGMGVGAYIIEVSNYARARRVPLAVPESAENSGLQIGSELGLAGILVALWAFLELVGQIRRSLAAAPPGSDKRFIVSGAAGGMAAFLLLIQVHTFIGSFEIKYFFWLLAGIVMAAGGPAQVESARPKSRRRMLVVAGIAVFAMTLLWNSTHSLSLGSRTGQFDLVQNFGFGPVEKASDGREFRWTGKYGGAAITVDKPVIEIPIQASHPDIRTHPVTVKVRLITDFFKHKKLLGEISLRDNRWTTFSFPVQGDLGRKAILLIEVDRTWNPQKLLRAPDPRNLGVAVGAIRFVDPPAL